MKRSPDMEDFAGVVRNHQSMVFSIAYHFLRDRSLAEEVAQDVFLRLHAELGRLESADHVEHWLRKVAVHRCIDCVRAQKARPYVDLETVAEPSVEPSEIDPLLSRRLRELVWSLPEKQRAVVLLRYQEDMDLQDIASTLEMPLGTVKSHLQRALALLREKAGRVLGAVNL